MVFSGPTQPCHPYVEGCFTRFDPVDMPADNPLPYRDTLLLYRGSILGPGRELIGSDSEKFQKQLLMKHTPGIPTTIKTMGVNMLAEGF